MFDHILLALDEPGDRALLLPVLRHIARGNGARVTVMHSAPFLGTLMDMTAGPTHNPHPEDDVSAELFVHAMVAHLRGEGFAADGFTEIGQSGVVIAAAAERVGASVILLALRHPAWLKSLLRVAMIPVLTVPAARVRRSANILVPLEDERSLEAIPYAAGMARSFQGGLTFVASDREALLQQAREAAARELVTTEATLLSDDLPATILSLSAAMIVLRATSDASAKRMIEASRVPLLLVRRPLHLPEAPPPEPIQAPLSMRKWRAFNPFEGFGEP